MTDAEKDAALLQKHVDQLMEQFDSVVLFTTRHEQAQSEGTVNLWCGAGNWFARYGQVREWLVRQEEQARINIRTSQ